MPLHPHVIAIFNTSEDTTEGLRLVFEEAGFVIVTAFTNLLHVRAAPACESVAFVLTTTRTARETSPEEADGRAPSSRRQPHDDHDH